MTPESLANLSNLTIPTATVVYACALVAHAVEWAGGRSAAVPRAEAVLVGVGRPAEPLADTPSVVRRTGSGRSAAASRIGVLLTCLAFALHATGVVTRGLAASRVPWGNMYEFSITTSLAVVGIYLALVLRYRLQWLGLGVVAVAATTLGLAVLKLYTPAGPLVPALHSYWMVIHVSAAAIAGGGFTVGALMSALYLLKERAGESGALSRLPDAASIDALAYKVHAFAFPIWTFGVLVAGPIWAEYAWGRYWGWDAKEIWALITWIIYAAYLHARATAGWRGRRAAVIALLGWGAFLFDFVGVNLFISGMHSYAGVS
jgi:cytochrome c-type biogenesis protein CcsB